MLKVLKKKIKEIEKDAEEIAKHLIEINRINSDDLRIKVRDFLADEFMRCHEQVTAIKQFIERDKKEMLESSEKQPNRKIK